MANEHRQLKPKSPSRWISGFIALLSTLLINTASLAQTLELNFVDVEQNNRYYESILDLYTQGVIQGYPDQTFRPNQTISRAEVLKIILTSVNPAGIRPPNLNTIPFEDVTPEAWYAFYVTQAYEWGIIQGYPEDPHFYPEKPVNQVEALKMILDAWNKMPYQMNIETSPALDVPMDSWFTPYVQVALENKIIYPDAGGNIQPGSLITRGKMAELIHRLKNSEQFSGVMEYGKATFYSGRPDDTEIFTAAHKTLPFGSYIRVINRSNEKTVVVKINDRGPWGEGRIIDLSSAAFEQLSPLSRGVIDVEIEMIYK